MDRLLKEKREHVERLAKELGDFAASIDGKDGGPTAEDSQQLVARSAGLKSAMDEFKQLRDAKKDQADVAKYLGDLAEKPSNGQLLEQVKTNGGNEVVAAKTVGQRFVESEEYKETVGPYIPRGSIPQGVKINMRPIEAKDLITGAAAGSGGALVRDDRYGPLTDLVPFRPFTIRDLVTRATTQSDTIEYVRVTSKTNAAAPVAEATATTGTTGTKPESALGLEVVATNVRTLAHWIPATNRALADAGQIRALIDTFLRDGLREEEEDQLLTGDGTGENLTGILNTAGIQTTAVAGTAAARFMDAVLAGIRLVQWTGGRAPNGIVAHPNDWFSDSFLTAKDADGRYLIGDPGAAAGQNQRLWGLPVAVTPAITEGTALVGDFRFAVLWDREQTTIATSSDVNDFFIRNMVAIRAEERLAFGVLDPQSFCTVTGV